MEKNKNLQIIIQSWEQYTMDIKLCFILVKIYAAIMVKVTFDVKSNI